MSNQQTNNSNELLVNALAQLIRQQQQHVPAQGNANGVVNVQQLPSVLTEMHQSNSRSSSSNMQEYLPSPALATGQGSDSILAAYLQQSASGTNGGPVAANNNVFQQSNLMNAANQSQAQQFQLQPQAFNAPENNCDAITQTLASISSIAATNPALASTAVNHMLSMIAPQPQQPNQNSGFVQGQVQQQPSQPQPTEGLLDLPLNFEIHQLIGKEQKQMPARNCDPTSLGASAQATSGDSLGLTFNQNNARLAPIHQLNTGNGHSKNISISPGNLTSLTNPASSGAANEPMISGQIHNTQFAAQSPILDPALQIENGAPIETWTLEQLESHVKHLQDINEAIPPSLTLLLTNARISQDRKIKRLDLSDKVKLDVASSSSEGNKNLRLNPATSSVSASSKTIDLATKGKSETLVIALEDMTLDQLESHVIKLEESNQPIPKPVHMLLQSARHKRDKRNKRKLSNRKSASFSRARKKAQIDAIVLENTRLRQESIILSQLPDPVMVIDIEGEISFVSMQMERVLRHDANELVGANIDKLLTPNTMTELRNMIQLVILAHKQALLERIQHDSGTGNENDNVNDSTCSDHNVIPLATERSFPVLEVNFDSKNGINSFGNQQNKKLTSYKLLLGSGSVGDKGGLSVDGATGTVAKYITHSSLSDSISKTKRHSLNSLDSAGKESLETSDEKESSPHDASNNDGHVSIPQKKVTIHRTPPIVPSCNVCLISKDLRAIYCEVTAAIRSSSRAGTDTYTTEESETEMRSTESKELLLCFRPMCEGIKAGEELRFSNETYYNNKET